jgi:acyl-CoA synthetase (AMP-forming)/AMP-acid ligase II
MEPQVPEPPDGGAAIENPTGEARSTSGGADVTTAPATFNFADLWEAVWPHVADRTAIVCGRDRRTYAELAGNANRMARHLSATGTAAGDHVAICMPNRVEWVEAMLAAFLLRAVPINLNHRYTAPELRAVLEADGARTVVFDDTVRPEMAQVVPALGITEAICVSDAGGDADPSVTSWAEALAAQPDERPDVSGRTGDDRYVIYTGGTTGRPKGVVWRQEDAFFGCIGGGDPMRLLGPVTTPDEVIGRIVDGFSFLPLAPMMHAAAQWTTLSWLFAGGKVTLMPGPLDPSAVWQAVQDEAVNSLTVVGDAVGRPLVAAWEAEPDRWDVSALFSISNGGAPMSAPLKARLAELFPGRVIVDGFGSSESGVQGSQRVAAEDAAASTGLSRFLPNAGTVVFDDDLRPVLAGSGVIGRVANTGRLPLGYLDDPEKTAATFLEVDGRRYCFSGDMATVATDGTIQLLGRGSQCINTGGEKVFPEEVETVLVDHPDVADVLVVGVPDPRWGRAVTAVVQPADPLRPPTLDDLRALARSSLAGYKLPKHLVLVDQVRRSPAGKADYPWATETAEKNVDT